jgi:hypothetical protein
VDERTPSFPLRRLGRISRRVKKPSGWLLFLLCENCPPASLFPAQRAGISAKNWAMIEALRDRYDHADVSATTVPASLS